ncbi:hypothetical protein BJ988_005594 [Nocardioides panzhihuensis]|uniref:Uncharacterized protein n=1 Tax=Nocardioides panzhihuensis TaxID=860243 RepID=A0A7Z0IVD4_9ACTN|nr:hypothetical protein [Nocardioides panzhihuensis]
MQQHPGGLRFEVGEGEVRKLGAAQRAGETEQDDRGVATPSDSAAVDRGQQPADLLGPDRMSGSAWRGTEDPVKSTAYLPNRLGLGRVVQAAAAVPVANRGAGQVDACR